MKFHIQSTQYYLTHFLGMNSNPCDACKSCPHDIKYGKKPCPKMDLWYRRLDEHKPEKKD